MEHIDQCPRKVSCTTDRHIAATSIIETPYSSVINPNRQPDPMPGQHWWPTCCPSNDCCESAMKHLAAEGQQAMAVARPALVSLLQRITKTTKNTAISRMSRLTQREAGLLQLDVV